MSETVLYHHSKILTVRNTKFSHCVVLKKLNGIIKTTNLAMVKSFVSDVPTQSSDEEI